MTTPASYQPGRPRERLHLRRPPAEVRPRRRRRDRLRPQPAPAPSGCSWSPTRAWRPPATRSGSPTRWAQFGIEAQVFAGSHVEPTDESLQRAIDCARDARAVGRVRGRGRRLEHRHRQGGQPADHQPRRADGLRQRAGRRGQGAGQPAASRWWPSPPPPAPASESTTICVLDVLAQKVKTGISHVRLRPALAVIDPSLTLPSRPASPPRPAWTSCATRSRATPRGPTRRTSASSPSSGCPTAAPTRSRTCGPRRR